jgi:hypothetical protein
MKSVIQFILGIVMAFLPPRYRAAGARLREQGMVSGILQLLVAIGVLLIRFYMDSWRRAGIIGPGVNTPSNLPQVNATPGGGIFMMIEFVLQPLNMLLLYLFYEGLIRYAAANFSDQVVGTLPFYVVSGVHGLIEKAKDRRFVGELIPDEIFRGSGKRRSQTGTFHLWLKTKSFVGRRDKISISRFIAAARSGIGTDTSRLNSKTSGIS